MRIYVCGDSTAASYTKANEPMIGWGQVLETYVHVPVENRAMAGRSSKSFLAEGRLQKIEGEIQKGDLLLIQFSHNDEADLVWRHTEPWTSFLNCLSIYVDTARQNGAVPVLLTPLCLRRWEKGQLLESHGEYPDAIRTLALQRGVPLIDMYAESTRVLREIGEEESRLLYMHVPEGVYARYPNGAADDTHFRMKGAQTWAEIIAEKLQDLKLIDRNSTEIAE